MRFKIETVPALLHGEKKTCFGENKFTYAADEIFIPNVF